MAILVAQAVELYQYVAEEKSVSLRAKAVGPLPITADADRIRQVLANLLDNAVKYTPAGGSVEVTAVSRDDAVVVAVADTGEGISPDDIPRIFDRLYRADKSRTQRGLGLGLSLVRAVLFAHGGTIDVHSTPGAGSRFQFSLPMRASPSGSRSRVSISSSVTRGRIRAKTTGRTTRMRKRKMSRPLRNGLPSRWAYSSMELLPIKRAILSVTDKTGLPELARFLSAAGVELVSTGGTRKLLTEAGLTVTSVSDVTGFPEIMTLRHGFGPAKILFLAERAFGDAYDRATLGRWLETFVRRFFSQQFKRSSMVFLSSRTLPGQE